jgi:preprotein translocase subunit SecY
MTAMIVICTAAIGAVQFFILKKITEQILILNKNPAIWIAVKIIIYAATAVLLLTLLREQIINAGIGFGAGFFVCALIFFIVVRRRDFVGKEEK